MVIYQVYESGICPITGNFLGLDLFILGHYNRNECSCERGTKKWTSLMMPEHHGMLQKMWSSLLDEDMPVIAEDKQEDMQVDIECAVKYDKEIRVIYHDGTSIDTVVGHIASVNHRQRRIEMLVPEEYGLVYIPYEKLVDTELM